MNEISVEDAVRLHVIKLASKVFDITTYHGGGRDIFAILPEDMKYPAIGFLVTETPAHGWKNPTKFIRFDSLDEAYAEYNKPEMDATKS